jgi:hypothetical protein
MDKKQVLQILDEYAEELDGILDRFTKNSDGWHIESEDRYRMGEISAELSDLIIDHIPNSEHHASMIVDYYNDGISNMSGSPSYSSVKRIKGEVKSLKTRIERNPSLIESVKKAYESDVSLEGKKLEEKNKKTNAENSLSKGSEYIRWDDDDNVFYAKVKGKTSESDLGLTGQPYKILHHLWNQYDSKIKKASESIDEVLYQSGVKGHKRGDDISGYKTTQLHVKVSAIRDKLEMAGFNKETIKVIDKHCELYIECI